MSIVPLIRYFPMFDVEAVETEFRMMQTMDELKELINLPIDSFWRKVGEVRSGDNAAVLANVAMFSKAMLSLTHSSAEVERVFSQLNLIKTKLRNRLLPTTCEALLLAKDLLKSSGHCCFDFCSSPSIRATSEETVGPDEEEAVCEIMSALSQ